MTETNNERALLSRRVLISAAVAAPLVVVAGESSPAEASPVRGVIDADFPSLEAALTATPSGGVLEVRTAHSRATTWTIDKPVTVTFTEAGSITTTSASIAAITIGASHVRLVDVRLTGTGGSTAGEGDGIRAQGSATSPIAGLHIERPRISEFAKHAVLLEHVKGFRLTDIDVLRCGYAGVMLISVANGRVQGGMIKDILQPTGFVNSYGVAVTRRSTGSITTTAPRSRDVLVDGLTIDGVLQWEALDTHAGENITFQNNTIYNARTGIAIIGSKDETGVGTIYAPVACRAVNNVLSSGKGDGTAGVGIVFAGAADTVGVPTEMATGNITGNIIRDYGAQNTSSGCSIQLYGTAGVAVSGNTIINSGFSGIDFYHDNYGTKASDNTIIDVWSDSASSCYAVQLRSAYNRVSIAGTTIVRQAKSAVKVNERGLNVSAFATNVVRDGGGNDWAAAATLATAGDVLTSENRNYAKKVGLYGVAPVGRASAIASPAVDAASLKTAVDAIRAALANIGITN